MGQTATGLTRDAAQSMGYLAPPPSRGTPRATEKFRRASSAEARGSHGARPKAAETNPEGRATRSASSAEAQGNRGARPKATEIKPEGRAAAKGHPPFEGP